MIRPKLTSALMLDVFGDVSDVTIKLQRRDD